VIESYTYLILVADLCKLSAKDNKLRSLQHVYGSLREKVIEKFDEKISMAEFVFLIDN